MSKPQEVIGGCAHVNHLLGSIIDGTLDVLMAYATITKCVVKHDTTQETDTQDITVLNTKNT